MSSTLSFIRFPTFRKFLATPIATKLAFLVNLYFQGNKHRPCYQTILYSASREADIMYQNSNTACLVRNSSPAELGGLFGLGCGSLCPSFWKQHKENIRIKLGCIWSNQYIMSVIFQVTARNNEHCITRSLNYIAYQIMINS